MALNLVQLLKLLTTVVVRCTFLEGLDFGSRGPWVHLASVHSQLFGLKPATLLLWTSVSSAKVVSTLPMPVRCEVWVRKAWALWEQQVVSSGSLVSAIGLSHSGPLHGYTFPLTGGWNLKTAAGMFRVVWKWQLAISVSDSIWKWLKNGFSSYKNSAWESTCKIPKW